MKMVPGVIDAFIEKLEKRDAFAWTRYGDGEWACILGDTGANCDGVTYSKKLRTALRQTLYQPRNYHYGMLAIAVRKYRAGINSFLREKNINITWIESTFLVQANRNGNLGPFIKSLQNRRILYVGPDHLRGINSFLPIEDFIEVHPTHAFDEREWVVNEVVKRSKDFDLVGISAGPGAKVMVYDLFGAIGKTHTIVDFGSVWDGYVGHPSRKYMKRPSWNGFLAKNLNGK